MLTDANRPHIDGNLARFIIGVAENHFHYSGDGMRTAGSIRHMYEYGLPVIIGPVAVSEENGFRHCTTYMDDPSALDILQKIGKVHRKAASDRPPQLAKPEVSELTLVGKIAQTVNERRSQKACDLQNAERQLLNFFTTYSPPHSDPNMVILSFKTRCSDAGLTLNDDQRAKIVAAGLDFFIVDTPAGPAIDDFGTSLEDYILSNPDPAGMWKALKPHLIEMSETTYALSGCYPSKKLRPLNPNPLLLDGVINQFVAMAEAAAPARKSLS